MTGFGARLGRRRTRTSFERRLARARAARRPQYIRIQASHLQQTGKPELLRAALALLDRVIGEYPSDFQAALAQSQRADGLLALGEWAGPADAFRAALQAEATFPTVRTDAYLSFAFLVVTRDERPLFDEVARVCQAHASEPRPFPVQQFRWHAVQALLTEADRKLELASRE